MASITAPRKAKQQVVMRVEATYGTDPFAGTYLAADIIQAVSDSVRFTPTVEEIPNLATAGALGRLSSGIGQRTGTVTFDVLIRGADAVAWTALIKPEADLPLRGCGLGAAFAAGKWSYVPTDLHESVAIYIVQDIPPVGALTKARVAKLLGCCGNVRAAMQAAGTGRYTFTFQGTLLEFADIDYVPSVIKPLPALPTLRAAGLNIGEWGPCVESINFDMANALRRVPCANAESGSSGFMIADREPTVELNPQMDREETSGIWDSLSDADPLKAVGWTLGQVSPNKVSFHVAADDSPGGQIIGDEWGERDGIAADTLRIRATLRDAPNTDFKIVYE